MATSDQTVTLERDLRSADREFKRNRDFAAKWMYGARPLNDHIMPAGPGEKHSELWHGKSPILVRPYKKTSEWSHTPKKSQNINKGGANFHLPAARIRSAGHPKEELQDASLARSLVDLLPTGQGRRATNDAPSVVESADVPFTPQPLSIFVKITGRETENLVEKEYEVLDDNGQPLKGRKARYNLRHGNSKNIREDEGFELL